MDKDRIKKQLIAKQLKGYQVALELIPSIKETIKKFDGKQASKRIDTALKKIDGNLSFVIEYNSFRLKYYNRDRYISTGEYTEYIREDVIDIVFNSVTSSYNDGICQDGVLNYKNFILAIDGRAECLTKYIEETNKQLNNLKELQEEKSRIEKLKNAYNDKINFVLNGYFDLRIK